MTRRYCSANAECGSNRYTYALCAYKSIILYVDTSTIPNDIIVHCCRERPRPFAKRAIRTKNKAHTKHSTRNRGREIHLAFLCFGDENFSFFSFFLFDRRFPDSPESRYIYYTNIRVHIDESRNSVNGFKTNSL